VYWLHGESVPCGRDGPCVSGDRAGRGCPAQGTCASRVTPMLSKCRQRSHLPCASPFIGGLLLSSCRRFLECPSPMGAGTAIDVIGLGYAYPPNECLPGFFPLGGEPSNSSGCVVKIERSSGGETRALPVSVIDIDNEGIVIPSNPAVWSRTTRLSLLFHAFHCRPQIDISWETVAVPRGFGGEGGLARWSTRGPGQR